MYILAICHTETIARYFYNLEIEINNIDSRYDFIYICSYPSAYYFLKENGRNAIILPKYIHNNIKRIKKDNYINKNLKIYKGYNLEDYIYFHRMIQKDTNSNIAKLKEVAKQYIDFFEVLFESYNINKVLVWGEGRLITDIPVEMGKRNLIDIFYYEQGPYSTIMFDKVGINYNSSFKNMGLQDVDESSVEEKVKKFIKRKKEPQYYKIKKGRYLYKVLDFIWMAPPKFFSKFLPLDTQTHEAFKDKIFEGLNRVFGKPKKKGNLFDISGNNIFLALQVPWDAQMILHSPNFNSISEMVKEVYQSLPEGFNLIIKEHPLYIGKYEKEIYSFINEHDNIYIVNDIDLNTLFNNVELVIVNNSTLGIEALANYKKVITLGNAFYNKKGIVWHYNKSEGKLKNVINNALKSSVDKELINKFLYNLFYNYLIDDHHKNHLYKNGKYVAECILKDDK